MGPQSDVASDDTLTNGNGTGPAIQAVAEGADVESDGWGLGMGCRGREQARGQCAGARRW